MKKLHICLRNDLLQCHKLFKNHWMATRYIPWDYALKSTIVYLVDTVELITARIRIMGEGTVFSLFVSSHPGGYPSQVWGGGYPISGLGGTPSQVLGYPISGLGGYPHHRSGGVPHLRSGGVPHLRSGGTPSQVWGGPHLRSGWVPLSPEMGQGTPPSSIASTCYVAGGMPLAFTQEDFLVCSLKLTFEFFRFWFVNFMLMISEK